MFTSFNKLDLSNELWDTNIEPKLTIESKDEEYQQRKGYLEKLRPPKCCETSHDFVGKTNSTIFLNNSNYISSSVSIRMIRICTSFMNMFREGLFQSSWKSMISKGSLLN